MVDIMDEKGELKPRSGDRTILDKFDNNNLCHRYATKKQMTSYFLPNVHRFVAKTNFHYHVLIPN